MNEVLDIKNWYLENFKGFENSLNGASSGFIHQLRKKAIRSFEDLNFPTTHDEEWKYTNIAPLLMHNFIPSGKATNLSKGDITKFLFDDLNGSLLVFVNGYYVNELSDLRNLPKGVVVQNFASALKENYSIVQKYYGKYADYKNHIFTALSTAFIKDGAFIYVSDGKILNDPIHLLFITSTKNDKILVQPRNLFVAGKNSQFKILEHYVSLDEDTYFTNSVTEIFTDENAIVDHIKLQEESKKAFHIARMEVNQEKSSNFTSHLISLGGGIARNDINSRFNDEGGECMLNGLFLTSGTQLFDVHSMIDHAKPLCNSHEHYKGILDDKSRGVFNGKVMVRRDAQKTNAFQENNNILLSTEALINTKPQLEIFADDVKCSHGATIGQLDADSMFYLKSRGIPEDIARGILIHAFASDVIKYIKIDPIRNYLENILENKFNKN
ncbi:MAG TPA: Fe-S cluster assembly protein SufD [Ignavibacteria bacterium]|nr:Fe-S cluster assembly protein SufD [Ignavibacteria bacterium]